jgi:CubicO group peptidase (beta-lactamase class C family)
MNISIDNEDLSTWVKSLMERWHVPGLTLSVIKNDEVIYSNALGLADVENETPMTQETLMPIGSLTKPLISNAAAICVERGLLDLDAPVQSYLPFFQMSNPASGKEATVRDFLAMRTGLTGDDSKIVDQLDHHVSLEEVVRQTKDLDCTHELRERFIYSGHSFCIIALVLEKVTERRWQDILRDDIFIPLGMDNVTLSYGDALESGSVARSYDWTDDSFQQIVWKQADRETEAPTGTVCATLTELTAWTRMLLNHGQIGNTPMLTRETLEELMSPHIITRSMDIVFDFSPEEYGLAWGRRRYRGHEMVYHRGTWNGFRASITMVPAENLGVVVQVNGKDSLLPHLISITLLDVLVENSFIGWEPLVKAYDDLRNNRKAV